MSSMEDMKLLEDKIRQKQSQLTVLQESHDIETIEQIEAELDTLQRQYANLKHNIVPDEEAVQPPLSGELLKSYKFERPPRRSPNELPSLDEQIAFVEVACKQGQPIAQLAMEEAIYQSLVQAKLGQTHMAGGPLEAMKKVNAPYNLDAQHDFVEVLIGQLAPKSDAERDLLKMYVGIAENLQMAMWVMANRLPGNKPDAQPRTVGDLEIYLNKEVDGYLATFNDWCDAREMSGFGKTAEAAIADLFINREKIKQRELFPEKEVSHE